jgi:Ribosomal protein S2
MKRFCKEIKSPSQFSKERFSKKICQKSHKRIEKFQKSTCNLTVERFKHWEVGTAMEGMGRACKVIGKKLSLGTHIGYCKSKYSSHCFKSKEIPLSGVRGDLLLLRSLSSQRYIFQTLLFLFKLLRKGGRLLVVDTSDRKFSILQWAGELEGEGFVFPRNRRGLETFSQRPVQLMGWEMRRTGRMESDSLSNGLRSAKGKYLTEKGDSLSQFPCSGEKWFGGTLTNWEEISKKIYQFGTLRREIPSKLPSLSSRYEKWMKGFPGFISPFRFAERDAHQIGKLHIVEGLRSASGEKYVRGGKRILEEIKLKLGKQVDGILLINPTENMSIISEARVLKIPVIAFADPSTNLSNVNLSLPLNLSSVSEIFFFLSILFGVGGSFSLGNEKE